MSTSDPKHTLYPFRTSIFLSQAAADRLKKEVAAEGTNLQIVVRAAIDAGLPLVEKANKERRESLKTQRFVE